MQALRWVLVAVVIILLALLLAWYFWPNPPEERLEPRPGPDPVPAAKAPPVVIETGESAPAGRQEHTGAAPTLPNATNDRAATAGNGTTGTLDHDADGRGIEFHWKGLALTVRVDSSVPTDRYCELSLMADFGDGFEEYFGGASAAWGSKFNGNRNTSHWERTKLGSGDTVKVVITYFGTSGEVTDTEEVYLTAP